MIKVLHTEWSDGWGGQEIRIIHEIKSMNSYGVFSAIACRKDSKIYLQARKEKIKCYLLPFGGNFDIVTLFKLVKIINKEKFQIINTHSGKDTWVGGIASKISGIKFIRTRHSSNLISASRINFINSLADFIITTGESVRLDMISRNRINVGKIESIPTGPDDKYFDPSKFDKSNLKTDFNLCHDEIIIGTLAVLRGFKRHDRFITMAERILEIYPNKKIKFLIAGDGPQKTKLTELITKKNLSNKVDLLGHLNNPAEFLSILDLFILSSDSGEGVPQSLIQALLMNIPSISTDVGSVLDLYSEKNFRVINKDSQDALDNSVCDFLSNKNFLFKETRTYIRNNFSQSVMAKKVFNIYNKLI